MNRMAGLELKTLTISIRFLTRILLRYIAAFSYIPPRHSVVQRATARVAPTGGDFTTHHCIDPLLSLEVTQAKML